MKDLQELINEIAAERAAKKANYFAQYIQKDLEIWNIIKNWNISEADEKGSVVHPNKLYDFHQAFAFGLTSTMMASLVEALALKYIPEESQRFMNKVEKLPQAKAEK